MVFLVPSDTNSKTAYRVDLLAHNGAGECSCKDWSTRRGPNIKAGKPIGSRDCLCKHVIRARWFFLNDLLAAMAKSECTPPPKPPANDPAQNTTPADEPF